MDLIEAIRQDDLKAFQQCLDAGADCQAPDADGTTPLHWAVWLERKEMVRRLLGAGADVNAANGEGGTPLLTAADSCDADMVRLLLEAGAKANMADRYGRTPLTAAASNEKLDVLHMLLEAGAEVDAVAMGKTPLMTAIAWNNRKLVDVLLEAGADVNAQGPTGETALLQACAIGNTVLLRRLLEAGADAAHVAHAGQTPLLAAIAFNEDLKPQRRLKNVRLLLEAGADPHAAFQYPKGDFFADLYPAGTTALMLAARAGHVPIVEALLEAGADPHARNERGKTAMQLAAKAGHAAVVGRLREAGAAEPIDEAAYRVAALMQAAQRGDAPRLRAILKAGVDPNAVDPDPSALGRTALVHAACSGSTEAVCALLEAGANPNCGENRNAFFADGGTALHFAAMHDAAGAIRALAQAGAALNVADKQRHSPLSLAAIAGHTAAVQALAEAGVDVKAPCGPNGYSPLVAAILNDHEATAQALIAAGAALDGPALVAAAQHGMIDLLRAALAAGVSANVCAALSAASDADDDGENDQERLARTPLIAAAEFSTVVVERDRAADVIQAEDNARWLQPALERQLETFDLLLAAGADVHGRDERQRTALLALADLNTSICVQTLPDAGARHISGEIDPRPAMRRLLAAGADINAADHAGNTVLHRLAGSFFGEAVRDKALAAALAAGADVNRQNHQGETPLMLACTHRLHGLVRRLLKLGADVNLANRQGETPLMRAIGNLDEKSAKRLIAAGADVNARNAEGVTALDLAMYYDHYDERPAVRNGLLEAGATDDRRPLRELLAAIDEQDLPQVQAMLQAGVNVNAAILGRAPLAVAAGLGNVEIVRCLLAAGASPQLSFAWNGAPSPSPLMAAIEARSPEIVRLLLEAGADPNERDSHHRTALVYAAGAGERELANLLLRAGAERDAAANDFLAVLEFAEKSQTPEFQQAVAELATLCNTPATPIETGRLKGGVYYHILADEEAEALVAAEQTNSSSAAEWVASQTKVANLLRRVQDDFLRRGFFVVDMGRGGPCVNGRMLGLLPTADKYAVIAAIGTGCNDGENGPVEVIAWFRELEKDYPFRLLGCRYDTVNVEFLAPIEEPLALARRMYRFCRDMVTQGAGTIELLAESLHTTRRAHFWWD